MFVSFGDDLQLGVDCAAVQGVDRHIVFGWHMAPRGLPVELGFSTADGRFCRIEHISRHARPDVVPQDPGAAVVVGFSLVVTAPPGTRGLVMTVGCGDQLGRADLTDPAVKTDLSLATLTRDWGTTFSLLAECRDFPDQLPLLSYQYRPFGAFVRWLALLPHIEGHGRDIGVIAEVVACFSPAGEVLIDLRYIGRSSATVEVQMVVAARLACPEGGPDKVRLLPLMDCSAVHLPGSSALYGRLEWEHVGSLRGLDLIVQVVFDAERVWLRCQARPDPVPTFLDLVGTAPAGRLGHSLLREVMAHRHAFFLTQAATEARTGGDAPPSAEASLPALAIIGVDDTAGVRLLHLLAPALEAAGSSIILSGAAAETAAQVFIRRGSLPVEVADEVDAIVRSPALLPPGQVALLFLPHLAQAAISRDVGRLIQRSCQAGLDSLVLLHRVAGPTNSLGDSLARHALLAEDPYMSWEPVDQAWTTSLGAELVNEHLETMWRHAPEPRP